MKYFLCITALAASLAPHSGHASPDRAASFRAALPPVDPKTEAGRDHSQGEMVVRGGDATQTSLVKLALAGAVATMIGDAAMHPIDCIKTLQQSNAGIGLNMAGAARKIFADSGAGGFYSGLGTYVTSDGVAGSLKFATYEALKSWVSRNVPEKYHNAATFGCAAAAFVASSVVLVPGELVKQRLQMGQISSFKSGVAYIWKSEGISGFFHGYAGVCYRDIPYTMLELGLYDNFKRIYMEFKNRGAAPGEELKITQFDEIVAAAVTGGITGYLSNPLDTIKTKLMTDSALYTGFADCFWKTVRAGGWGTLFQGGAARVAWLMPFTAIYLPVYDYFKRLLEKAEMAGALRGGSDGRGSAAAAFVAPRPAGVMGVLAGGAKGIEPAPSRDSKRQRPKFSGGDLPKVASHQSRNSRTSRVSGGIVSFVR